MSRQLVSRRARTAIGLTAAFALVGVAPIASAASPAAPAPASASATAADSSAIPSNVSLFRTKTSLLGVHHWYQQMLSGYPVVGGMYAVHSTTSGPAAGTTSTWDGRVAAGPLGATDATVSSTDAIAAAVAYTGGRALTFVAPQLWVLPGADQSQLVWGVSSVVSGTTTKLSSDSGAHLTYVSATTGAVVQDVIESRNEDDTTYVTGSAKVFDPNPVVKLQDESLTDQADSDSAVPKKGYSKRKLKNLDKSHTLVGKWAKVVNDDLVGSPDDTYNFKRSNDDFEQVMDYYALDTEQQYYQDLGFDDVNAEPQKIEANAMADDNSWYIPSQDLIQTGTGGVDDAEDPEVTWHEGGHATQDDQVPGFGQGSQAGAIGEAYGDYIAITLSQKYGKDTETTPAWCVMDWDSVSYTGGPMHCLRTAQEDKHYPEDLTGEVHADGEIWSQALYEMSLALGLDKATTAIVEAQFSFAPNTNMPTAAKTTVSTAKQLYGKKAAKKAKKAFKARGIL